MFKKNFMAVCAICLLFSACKDSTPPEEVLEETVGFDMLRSGCTTTTLHYTDLAEPQGGDTPFGTAFPNWTDGKLDQLGATCFPKQDCGWYSNHFVSNEWVIGEFTTVASGPGEYLMDLSGNVTPAVQLQIGQEAWQFAQANRPACPTSGGNMVVTRIDFFRANPFQTFLAIAVEYACCESGGSPN